MYDNIRYTFDTNGRIIQSEKPGEKEKYYWYENESDSLVRRISSAGREDILCEYDKMLRITMRPSNTDECIDHIIWINEMNARAILTKIIENGTYIKKI
ncbi:MAG: hypothetical protein PHC62_00455 [Candidatus Izemoplasmatales bacterium]|nr:hypothetical protein [Candidatus Izemoplasmatales bacterium]